MSGARAAYAHLEVLATGALALVEDLGRPGLSSMGVSPSGAADRGAFALGARLLGQSTAQAAIECVFGGLEVRARGSMTAVLTGALAPAELGGIPAPHAAPFLLRDGQVLRLGRPLAGLRSYLSVGGGVDVAPVLGSRSYDTLAELGPAPLRAGQLLPVGQPAGEPLVDLAPVATAPSGPVELGALPGPRLEWLADRGDLGLRMWQVGAASDRVGVRLEGRPLARASARDGQELPSEGVVRGAVQLTSDGQLVIFLADHPVTGGYPVVAVLTEEAADHAAQLVAGQQVRLRLVTSRARR